MTTTRQVYYIFHGSLNLQISDATVGNDWHKK